MEIIELISAVFEQLGMWGAPGLIILLLLATIVILWHTLNSERQRSQALVDKMFTMSQEVSTMIERISGR
jgi:hypothetical protein